MEKIKVSTIANILASPIRNQWIVAAKQCGGRSDIPLSLINRWSKICSTEHMWCVEKALSQKQDVPINVIKKWMYSGNKNYERAAIAAMIGRQDIPLEMIDDALYYDIFNSSTTEIVNVVRNKNIPMKTIEEWLHYERIVGNLSCDAKIRYKVAACGACCGKEATPEIINIIEDTLFNIVYSDIDAMIYVCCDIKNTPVDVIDRWLHRSGYAECCAAIHAGRMTNIPPEIISKWAHEFIDSGNDLKFGLLLSMCEKNPNVPAEIIIHALKMKNVNIYSTENALKCCYVRNDIPHDLILACRNDGIESSASEIPTTVRREANKLANYLNIPFEKKRDFNPPEKVYKKCAGDIIITAHIPEDAQVRGSLSEKCRADKAEIIAIDDTYFGEKVGVSMYNKVDTYHVGDKVFIENFDPCKSLCSTGFHFFCNKEDAIKYSM